MKNIVLKFGLISGAILAAMTSIMVPLCMNGTLPFESSELLGYSIMVLSFIAVFFGIRTYRENVGNGTITFGRAFKVGILMTLITCAVYVTAWEIVYWNFLPDFGERYAALSTERLRAGGASAAEVAEHQRRMAQFQEWYKNPFFNVGMTFLEVFPVGLLVTLISAAILRKKPEAPAGAAVAA